MYLVYYKNFILPKILKIPQKPYWFFKILNILKTLQIPPEYRFIWYLSNSFKNLKFLYEFCEYSLKFLPRFSKILNKTLNLQKFQIPKYSLKP